MKHVNSEIGLGHEDLARTFIMAAFEKKQLAEQIDTLYESVDNLGVAMDVESRQKLFENTSEQMKKLGARLMEIEQQLNEMLPDFLALTESIEQISSSNAIADATLSFAAGDTATASDKAEPQSPPEPLLIPQLMPEKPTLIAMEPAPMVNADENENNNNETYQFEEDDDFDLPEEDVFDAPLGVLPSTEPAPVVNETNQVSSSDVPPAFTETRNDADDGLANDGLSEVQVAHEYEDIKITEERHVREVDPSDVTEPIVRQGANHTNDETIAELDDDAFDEGLDNSPSTSLTAQEQADESWSNVPQTNTSPKATIRFGNDATWNDANSEATHETNDAPNNVAKIELKKLAQSDALESSSTESADNVHAAVEYQGNASELPEDLANTLEPENQSILPDETHSTDGPSLREEQILFWKQSPGAEPPINMDAPAGASTTADSAASGKGQFVLSRIPSLFPRDATSAKQQFEGLDDALNHIQNYDETEEDISAMDSPDNVDVDVDDVREEDSHEIDNPLERELYEMLDMQASATNSGAASSQKQTLVGLGAVDIDTDMNSIESDKNNPSANADEDSHS